MGGITVGGARTIEHMFDSVMAALDGANDLDPKAFCDRQLADGLAALERARALLDALS